MKTGRNRPGRQDQPRFARADSGRRQGLARWAALLLIAVAAALATTGPAQAETGGVQAWTGSASTAASSDAGAGPDLAFTPLRWAGATWYGPGLYGGHTACGQRLRPDTIGVAHRNLPCGTAVKFVYRGRQIVTTVIDRGPYTRGNAWDLTNGARQLLGFDGSGPIRYAVSLQYARQARGGARAAR